MDFSNIETRVPSIYGRSDRRLLNRPRPRFLKSHEYYDPRYGKVIYLVRDPRDIVVSYYHYHKKIARICEDHSLGEYVCKFLQGKVDDFPSWGHHVKSWIDVRDDSGFLCILYEDLVEDTLSQVHKIASFLGVDETEEAMRAVVELSSFERMRSLEERSGSSWEALRGAREKGRFVRRGEVGGWRDELPSKLADKIVVRWRALMERLGYL